MVHGTKGRRELKVRCCDNIKEIFDGKLVKLYRMAQSRRKRRATAVYFGPPVIMMMIYITARMIFIQGGYGFMLQ